MSSSPRGQVARTGPQNSAANGKLLYCALWLVTFRLVCVAFRNPSGAPGSQRLSPSASAHEPVAGLTCRLPNLLS